MGIVRSWRFDSENDHTIDMILEGKKKGFLVLHEKETYQIGQQWLLVYDNEKEAAFIESKSVAVMEFQEVTEEMAILNGKEREVSFEQWKKQVLMGFCQNQAGVGEDVLVEWILFEVKENLVLKRYQLAEKISRANSDIVGGIDEIVEINAGFNNSLFDVNHKYMIKICCNPEMEHKFDIEAGFYQENRKNENIPQLYRYDKRKKVVPYVYEILERVEGKTVYYHWYRMNEWQRKQFVYQLVAVVKNIHKERRAEYSWADAIKEKMEFGYCESKMLFTPVERKKIEKVIEMCEEILVDNRFCQIHNDIHFDNILLDENNRIRLIDFNDAIVAPFDYDFRFLYMMVDLPWKWANVEMEAYQRKEDYKNLFVYVKKFYHELDEIKYLDERMLLYSILNDLELLRKFNKESLKRQIIANVEKVLQRFTG